VTEGHGKPGVGLHECRHVSLPPKNAKRQRELPRNNQL
jgi:hypothetical protein